jgi:hypothetical protein
VTRTTTTPTNLASGRSAGPAQGKPAATSSSGKPGKAFIFFVLIAFCLGGAIVGGLAGAALGFKGADFPIVFIVAGAGAGYEFLRRKGAFPSKKKPGQ